MNTFVNNTLDNDLSSTPYFPNIGENANFFIIFPAFSQNSPPPFSLDFSGWPQTWKTGNTGKYQGNSKYWKYQGIIREILINQGNFPY